MIARTASSTSAEASRLVARKARKRSAKSAAGCRGGSAWPFLPDHTDRITAQWRGEVGVSASIRLGRQPRASVASRCTGRSAAGQDGPRSAISASRHSTSSLSARPAGEDQGHDPGGRVGFGEFDRQQVEHRILAGGIDWRHLQQSPARNAAPSGSAGVRAWFPRPRASRSGSAPTTSRFSCGRQMTSATLTRASCRCAETTSRSSWSRATNFTGSMTRVPAVLSHSDLVWR